MGFLTGSVKVSSTSILGSGSSTSILGSGSISLFDFSAVKKKTTIKNKKTNRRKKKTFGLFKKIFRARKKRKELLEQKNIDKKIKETKELLLITKKERARVSEEEIHKRARASEKEKE